MKQILLATALIALPVAGFTAFQMYSAPAQGVAVADPLGDLSALRQIVLEVGSLVTTGDMAAAKTRITDFETAWDADEARLRPMDGAAWGAVDDAADAALHALRAATPVPAEVSQTVEGLRAALENPRGATGARAAGGVSTVSGVAVTDATGRPLPCEAMLGDVAAGLTKATLTAADRAKVEALQARALERCNADDDTRADGFSAQALALLTAP